MMQRNNGRRRANIKRLTFVAGIHSSLDSDEAQTELGQTANNEAFTRSLSEFCMFLEGWDVCRKYRELEIAHLAINSPYPPESFYMSGRDRKRLESRDKPYLRYNGSSLPLIRYFDKLQMRGGSRIWPPSLVQIAASLDGLVNTDLDLRDLVNADSQLHLRYRQALGECISQLPASCRTFRARIFQYPYGFEAEPEVVAPALDQLCIGLRDLSMRLRHLSLEGICVSPALFWPGKDESGANTAALFWPNLETVKVEFERFTSFGQWLLDLDPELIWTGDPSRTVPKPEIIGPIFAAAGRAAQCMPALTRMEVKMRSIPFVFEPHLLFWPDERNGSISTVRWTCQLEPEVFEDEDEYYEDEDEDEMDEWGYFEPSEDVAVEWSRARESFEPSKEVMEVCKEVGEAWGVTINELKKKDRWFIAEAVVPWRVEDSDQRFSMA
ncbi:uncharacterized protein K452DRAFT_356929 [Aplosporella prunicola CBS 121167]|uniref:Uncharacterized protein n=1 Tax=Aplosporella prunicola CBS 121167 TaxID=1176127 RepID=A0A6A6BM97_9PEZI|nr:uncharacterized protein K452DRAFT_356929 [Aplosporella prunicola CBS 121167]KAF2143957.1 hypothetical protein K452DRAFT_356929 [Aplosporella prunicola CBS 121167]